MEKFRRRNYFIKKDFQARFILRFFVASTFGLGFALVLFNVLMHRKIDQTLYSMRVPAAEPGAFFFEEALYSNIIAAAVVVAILLLTSRAISNMLSGPLPAFRAEVQKLGRGYLNSRIILREDDEFKDFADRINALAAALDSRFSAIKDHAHHLSEAVRELHYVSDEEEGRLLRQKIREHIEELDKELRAFKK